MVGMFGRDIEEKGVTQLGVHSNHNPGGTYDMNRVSSLAGWLP